MASMPICSFIQVKPGAARPKRRRQCSVIQVSVQSWGGNMSLLLLVPRGCRTWLHAW